MKKHYPAFAMNSLLAINMAMAKPVADCESEAVSKHGKPLVGAASLFPEKCQAEVRNAAKNRCKAKAVDKNGKALAGAAKASFIKKCEADAVRPVQ